MVGRPRNARPWSSDWYFRGSSPPSCLDLDRVLSMLGPSRPAAVARYRRLMGEPADSIYEELPAIEGVVKGGEGFARPRLGPPRRVARPRMGWNAERSWPMRRGTLGRPVRGPQESGLETSESRTRDPCCLPGPGALCDPCCRVCAALPAGTVRTPSRSTLPGAPNGGGSGRAP